MFITSNGQFTIKALKNVALVHFTNFSDVNFNRSDKIFPQCDQYKTFSVSTQVICERLSAMQGLSEYGMAKFLLKIP